MDAKHSIAKMSTAKKHKSSHHSDKSSKKHSKSSKGSPMKKEKEPSPVKRKPLVISESESEQEDFQTAKPSVKLEPVASTSVASNSTGFEMSAPEMSAPGSTNSAPSAATPVKVKSEKSSSKVKSEKKAVKVKAESRSNGSEVPPAKRKASAETKVKTESGTTLSGSKRGRGESESEESEYEGESDDKDDDFKPSSAKKAKKEPKKVVKKEPKKEAPQRKKPAPATPSSAKKRGKAAATATPSSTARKSAAASVKAKKEAATASPVKGGRKKKEEEQEVWKWWEEQPHADGVKWLTLEHKGPFFAPPYEPLPAHVSFVYDGKPMPLSEKAEEAAGFFGKMLEHEYTSKDIFCNNFFEDWRKEMTREEAGIIKEFGKCDFTDIHRYYKERSEERKAMTKEQKQAIKKENEAIVEEYGWCMIDGHKEKIGNFKIEPPGLFRGRGDHPKQGKIKKRIEAESVIINIGQEATPPEPPPGHRWKEVQHDNKVTWLCSWTENIQGAIKYVMLNPTSRLKGEKDWAKYETARRLKGQVERIRKQYTEDWKSREMRIRQRAVALYFIDKLALRAGNEKDTDESADTVGCCSLRVEHIKLHETMDDKENVIEFDFLGKDSIRYYNCVSVERQVFKNVRLFMEGKTEGDDLFDRLTTGLLNKHLSELMEGLSAKVFRTYNASKTLQEQLEELTIEGDTVTSKFLSYNRANRAVAILCNHQRAAPKTFDQQMTNLQAKIQAKEDSITETKAEIKALKKEARQTKDSKTTKKLETKQKQLTRLEDQLHKLEVQATDKQENKEIALGTSKLNYLDPRISVAWCKKWEVPIEKIYNKTQRQKFAWAIDMAEADFEF